MIWLLRNKKESTKMIQGGISEVVNDKCGCSLAGPFVLVRAHDKAALVAAASLPTHQRNQPKNLIEGI
jgi:hypothetical protein